MWTGSPPLDRYPQGGVLGGQGWFSVAAPRPPGVGHLMHTLDRLLQCCRYATMT